MTSTGSGVSVALTARKERMLLGRLLSKTLKSGCFRPGITFPVLSVTTTARLIWRLALAARDERCTPGCTGGSTGGVFCCAMHGMERERKQIMAQDETRITIPLWQTLQQ